MKRITYELQGECKRCGICCEALKCEHLTYENIDNVRLAKCKLHGGFWKPYSCLAFPHYPHSDEIRPGCAYKWKVIKEEIT